MRQCDRKIDIGILINHSSSRQLPQDRRKRRMRMPIDGMNDGQLEEGRGRAMDGLVGE